MGLQGPMNLVRPRKRSAMHISLLHFVCGSHGVPYCCNESDPSYSRTGGRGWGGGECTLMSHPTL